MQTEVSPSQILAFGYVPVYVSNSWQGTIAVEEVFACLFENHRTKVWHSAYWSECDFDPSAVAG